MDIVEHPETESINKFYHVEYLKVIQDFIFVWWDFLEILIIIIILIFLINLLVARARDYREKIKIV